MEYKILSQDTAVDQGSGTLGFIALQSGYSNSTQNMFYSTDLQSWSVDSSVKPVYGFFAVNSDSTGVMFAPSSDAGSMIFPSARISPNGTSWSMLSGKFPAGFAAIAAGTYSRDASYFYAISSASKQLFGSSDGATWTSNGYPIFPSGVSTSFFSRMESADRRLWIMGSKVYSMTVSSATPMQFSSGFTEVPSLAQTSDNRITRFIASNGQKTVALALQSYSKKLDILVANSQSTSFTRTSVSDIPSIFSELTSDFQSVGILVKDSKFYLVVSFSGGPTGGGSSDAKIFESTDGSSWSHVYTAAGAGAPANGDNVADLVGGKFIFPTNTGLVIVEGDFSSQSSITSLPNVQAVWSQTSFIVPTSKIHYTAPSGKSAVVSSIFAANNATLPGRVDVHAVKSGEQPTTQNLVASLELVGNQTEEISSKITLDSGDYLATVSSSDKISINVFGVEL